MIGKELHAVHAGGYFERASQSPNGTDRLVDKRRADRATLDRQQLVRVGFEVAQRKRGVMLQPDAGAIAVIPGLRRVYVNFLIEFQLGGAAHGLTQDFRFEAKLSRVVDVLILAAAALAEVRAWRNNAVGRWRQDLF